MDSTDLPDATLDCWVERAELLRLNPRASAADIASISHWPRYTLDPELAEPIIERAQIVVDEIDDPGRGIVFFARRPHAEPVSIFVDHREFHGDTYLDAAMICYIASVFGPEVEYQLLWDDGTSRYEPYE